MLKIEIIRKLYDYSLNTAKYVLQTHTNLYLLNNSLTSVNQ